jgi:hypothetical protein
MFAVPVIIWIGLLFYGMVESGTKLLGHCRLSTIDAILGRPSDCAAAQSSAGLPTLSPNASVAQAIVAYATAQLGKPYIYGAPASCAGSPAGFDCSGLVKCAVSFATGGKLVLPHFTVTQMTQMAKWSVPRNDPSAWQPGDILYWFVPGDPVTPGHCGIYTGANTYIDAPHTGTVVTASTLGPDGTIGAGTRLLGVRRPGDFDPLGGGRREGVDQVGGAALSDVLGTAVAA